MRPLYPAIFSAEHLNAMKWADRPENVAFKNYLFNACREFPSLILASSSRPGMSEALGAVAEGLIGIGINVFMPPDPSPICAVSQAVSSRNIQMALYLDADVSCENFTLYVLTKHGGPPDEKDVCEAQPLPGGRTGVAGTTELDRYYASNVSALADHFIESGRGFSSIAIPFPVLEERLRSMPELSALFEHDPNGPAASVSADGQILQLTDRNGRIISPEQVAARIAKYLIKERLAAGTIVGPEKLAALPEEVETLKIAGSSFDMNYHAGFADLLIGWWSDGTMAHQGSSCFGDAILTAIYYIEALRSES